MKTHIIQWRSLINGIIGSGTFLFEKEEAERLAEELNRDYPAIHHEAVSSLSQQHVEPAVSGVAQAEVRQPAFG